MQNDFRRSEAGGSDGKVSLNPEDGPIIKTNYEESFRAEVRMFTRYYCVLRFQALIKRSTKLLDSDRLSRGQSCFLERNQDGS